MESTSLQLKFGKSYRTRDDRKAVIVHERDEGSALFRFIGYIEGTDLGLSWKNDGSEKRTVISDYDLIAEWKEPKRVKGWANIYEGSYEHPTIVNAHIGNALYDSRIEADRFADENFKRIACIEIDCLEGDGL